MVRSVLPYVAVAVFGAMLSGCGVSERQQRPAWRDQAEASCLQQKLVNVSAYVQPAREIDGPGMCGMKQPFKVAALANGTVALKSTGTMACPMIASLNKWVEDIVQPAAQARFGQPVAEISSASTYGCRPINNQRSAKLSEHSFGNAIDIGTFRLADGREVKIVRDWTRGDDQSRAFLRELHAGACDHFTTVLGPGSDVFHYNHFHFDLAMHGNTSRGPRRVCRPQTPLQKLPPRLDNLPDPPALEPDIDVASRSLRGPQLAASYTSARLGNDRRPDSDRRAGIEMQPNRLSAMPRPQGIIAAAPPVYRPLEGGGAVYGRLQPGVGAPLQLHRSLPRGTGILRDDGIFVAPGEFGD